MGGVVVWDWETWPRSSSWLLDLSTGECQPAGHQPAHGWTAVLASHRFALDVAGERLWLWIDGVKWPVDSLTLNWSTGDWEAGHQPMSHFVALDRSTLETQYKLAYPDPAWPIATADPTFDGIDHDTADFLFWLVGSTSRDRDWSSGYAQHLERGLRHQPADE